jgi:diadenosine tetraphosphate (Ap4A) HIT family hydrolase
MNDTIRKFGYPATRVAEWEHWIVLLRPAQPTAGSLVLAAKSDATAFSDLSPEAFAELAEVISAVERALGATVAPDKFNYLMLMMVDPHVHFHIIPRYAGERTLAGVTVGDAGWPGVPNLAEARALDAAETGRLTSALAEAFA